MGKRLRGAALRAKKRGEEAAKEMVETEAVRVEVGTVADKPDEELFVLDTTAEPVSKRQKKKEEEKRTKSDVTKKLSKSVSSSGDRKKIQKLIDTHSPEKLKKLASARQHNNTANSSNKRRRKGQKMSISTYDLWGDDEDDNNIENGKKEIVVVGSADKNKKKPTTTAAALARPHGVVPSKHVEVRVTKKAMPAPAPESYKAVTVEVAKSGQSYNPDRVEHRKAIEEALDVETKRERAQKEAGKPVSQGMSAETRALLLGDSDTEDDEDSDADENDDAEEEDKEQPIRPRREKLTRAQRNKQKRVRAEQFEIDERKRMKRMRHEWRSAKSIEKKLKKEESNKNERNEEIRKLKEQSERSKGTNVYKQLSVENPRYAPTYPVALPSELKREEEEKEKKGNDDGETTATVMTREQHHSLRTIRPKGSLVTDRMVSFMDRDMYAKKQLKLKRRVQGKRRKVKVRYSGKDAVAKAATKQLEILG